MAEISQRADDGRHYPNRPVVGIGVVVWRGDKILLVKRAQPPRQGEWGLPGGVQQLGETIFAAAMREVREETGLEITPLRIITALDVIAPDADQKIEYHYTIIEVVAAASDDQITAQDDALDVRWASLDEVEQLCAWPEVTRVVRLSRPD